MSYKVKTIEPFEKKAQKLFKKYPSLLDDILALIQSLKENPRQGNAIGQSCYKVRLAIKSKRKGKSGGARIITYVAVIEETVYLLAIYDKSEMATISENDLNKLLKELK